MRGHKHKAFTFTEVMIAMTIMAILAAAMNMNMTKVAQQTPQKEAERVAAFMQTEINRANIAMHGVWIQVNEYNIQVGYGSAYNAWQLQSHDLKATAGCKYSTKNDNRKSKFFYNIESQSKQDNATSHGWTMISKDSTVVADTNTDTQPKEYYFTVERADQQSCNVIIRGK